MRNQNENFIDNKVDNRNMKIKFKEDFQQLLLEKSIKKAGSERKLSKLVDIPKSSVNSYRNQKILISEYRVIKILKFLNIPKKEIENYIEKRLPNNWGAIKGGKKLITIMKKKGRFEDMIKNITEKSGKKLSKWHAEMKKIMKKSII